MCLFVTWLFESGIKIRRKKWIPKNFLIELDRRCYICWFDVVVVALNVRTKPKFSRRKKSHLEETRVYVIWNYFKLRNYCTKLKTLVFQTVLIELFERMKDFLPSPLQSFFVFESYFKFIKLKHNFKHTII
jgi:hypothetical protein